MTPTLSAPLALWRARHDRLPGELACIVSEPSPGVFAVDLTLNGQPVHANGRRLFPGRTRSLAEVVFVARYARGDVHDMGWRDVED